MGKNIVLFTTLILFLSECFLRRECSNVECQKDGTYRIAIKNFQGAMALKENFRFCSNNQAVVLNFKYCKVEQFLISRQELRIFYPKVRTISWQCLGKCLIEENEDIVNIYGCQKGKNNYLYPSYIFIYIYKDPVSMIRTYMRTLSYYHRTRSLGKTR